MKREVIKTSDGSTTIYLEQWEEHYHSKHGAIQEAYHVFIKSGLAQWLNQNDSNSIRILEIGFGTGLNAFISFLECQKMGLHINYHGVEAYPVNPQEVALLNYVEQLDAGNYKETFIRMHQGDWDTDLDIDPLFTLRKRKQFFGSIDDQRAFDLIYFDAFGARVQPELWDVSMFERMYKALDKNGILVTYAAKGSVRRAMQEVGFLIEKLPGPPGKREMLRAVKK
ncbi:tRNA (5-methylaminomethyl-2-thiouridine)(34)-methyltransferase MnmD [Galbibacter sp.]|jgi:tRNA U34 5-methylaminomethyl-2-thiouridine-forming methyltransferase MnmC|uniref:tRNA (5-methylaminomethyl-2-thiouridine)(34)-methyltransferase MnmD n=1 Tax=Galbibacter sp. TaxID=2918471 RepID=UPI003A9502A5